MTKVNKNFTISVELVEKLKQCDNASALIEELLKQHYKFNDEKKKNLIQNTAFQLKNYSTHAKKLKKEMKLLKEFENLKIDRFTLRWLLSFSECPGMNDTITYRRQRDINLNSDIVIKAWRLIQKDVALFEKV